MAWENANIQLFQLATVNSAGYNFVFVNGQYRDNKSKLSSYFNPSDEVPPSYWSQFPQGFLYGDSNLGIKRDGDYIQFWYQGNMYNTFDLRLSWGDGYRIIYCGINEETQRATFNILKRY